MVDHDTGPRVPRDSGRTAEGREFVTDGWSRTLRDMEMMAVDREESGFETVTIPATDTTPKSPESDNTDEFGLYHLIPDDKADRFLDLFEGDELTDTGVYQTVDNGNVFIVTEFININTESVALIAGTYQIQRASELVRAATSRNTMYTHLRTIDGTHLVAFEHDDVSAFFPNPDIFSTDR